MRVVVHPPTLVAEPAGVAGRVGAVVVATVRAELRRLDVGGADAVLPAAAAPDAVPPDAADRSGAADEGRPPEPAA